MDHIFPRIKEKLFKDRICTTYTLCKKGVICYSKGKNLVVQPTDRPSDQDRGQRFFFPCFVQ